MSDPLDLEAIRKRRMSLLSRALLAEVDRLSAEVERLLRDGCYPRPTSSSASSIRSFSDFGGRKQ